MVRKPIMNPKNKKGNYGSVFLFVVMAFLIVVFFGLMYYGFGKMNTVLNEVQFTMGNGQGHNNFTNIVKDTWGQVYDSYGQLKTVAYMLIFGMIFSILISSWMIKSPPIFLVIYLFVAVGGIIVGAYISNLYQGLLLNPEFGATLQSFKGGTYLLLYLPYLAGIVAFLSGLLSLIGLNRNKTENEFPI